MELVLCSVVFHSESEILDSTQHRPAASATMTMMHGSADERGRQPTKF